jgi:hypothetical protein
VSELRIAYFSMEIALHPVICTRSSMIARPLLPLLSSPNGLTMRGYLILLVMTAVARNERDFQFP